MLQTPLNTGPNSCVGPIFKHTGKLCAARRDSLENTGIQMDNVTALLSLPLQTLSVLTAGYLSYRLAYTGKELTHKATDVIFLVFVFAFIAQITGSLTAAFLQKLDLAETTSEAVSSLAGIAFALSSSAFWRKWGESKVAKGLKGANISHSDRSETAWQAVILKEHVKPSSLIVRKTDGSMVMSERLSDFDHLPFGCCIQGQDGSIALYITHKWSVGGTEWEERDPRPHGDFGAEVTYIPASEIAEISLRAG